jgi:hypothetical protein
LDDRLLCAWDRDSQASRAVEVGRRDHLLVRGVGRRCGVVGAATGGPVDPAVVQDAADDAAGRDDMHDRRRLGTDQGIDE